MRPAASRRRPRAACTTAIRTPPGPSCRCAARAQLLPWAPAARRAVRPVVPTALPRRCEPAGARPARNRPLRPALRPSCLAPLFLAALGTDRSRPGTAGCPPAACAPATSRAPGGRPTGRPTSGRPAPRQEGAGHAANQASTPTVELVQLDPRSLAEHPANIRTDLGDVTELAASIRSVGLLEPIVVVPVTAEAGDGKNGNDKTGGYRIIAGHRRVAAAIAAKQPTVPCVVRADLTGDVDQITGMIVENVLRANLTPAEEAAAYAQLAAFDLTPAAIAKRTGRATKTVRDALALHALPEQVKARVADDTMTLADAAAVEEFADDAKAYARLLKAADTGYGLTYALADERHRSDKKQRTDAAKAALTEPASRSSARRKAGRTTARKPASPTSPSPTASPATPPTPTPTAPATPRSSTTTRSRCSSAATPTRPGTPG